jgi:hypothetical protein
MPSLAGTGGRSSGVNYATSAMFGRMFRSLQTAPPKHIKRGAEVLAVTYQANTGASGCSLKRVAQGLGLRSIY